MQVPIVQMLELGSGALRLLNKALGTAKPEGFESMLTDRMAGVQGDEKSILNQLVTKLQAKDAEGTDDLAASEAGTMFLQLMATLKEAGLSAADIRALLTGKGVDLSDEVLKKMLAACGVADEKIQAILADQGFKDELKNQITQQLQQAMEQSFAGKSAAPSTELPNQGEKPTASGALAESHPQPSAAMEMLVRELTVDEATLAAALEKIGATVIQAATPLVGEIQSALKNMVQTALKKTDLKVQAKLDAQISAAEGLKVKAEVDVTISTLQDTVGIPKTTLEKLFFATDPSQRQAAVDEVTSKVAAYLKGQEGKPIGKDLQQALSLVRAATSKKEWAKIEGGLKLWRPDLQVPEVRVALDKGVFQALTEKLAGSNAGPVFDRYVEQTIDQIKAQIPTQVKNGEGTATIRLNPPMLGRVDVNIAMEDGKLQATFRVENQITKDMLQMNISILKETLSEQGIRVTQLSITTGLEYRQHQQQDAYAQLQQGRDESGMGNGRSGSGRQSREEGAPAYHETQDRGRLYASGGLDLFA